MHNRYGQGFRPNMQFAPLCQMHWNRRRKKMQRLATMAQFAQPNRTIFRLAQWRIGMLPRNGITIKKRAPARFFIERKEQRAMGCAIGAPANCHSCVGRNRDYAVRVQRAKHRTLRNTVILVYAAFYQILYNNEREQFPRPYSRLCPPTKFSISWGPERE